MQSEADRYLPYLKDDIANAKRATLRPTFSDAPEPQENTGPDINSIDWFSHALLVAAQGSGKTNLIRWRINQILPLIKEGGATLILLDPKDVLTKELPTLARQMGIEDRTILIDPIEAPVSFDLFDRGDGSRGAIHETVGRLIRILNTITLDLQPFQRDTLSLAIRVLFAISHRPSFASLLHILRDGKEGVDLTKLTSSVRDILEHDFKPADGRFVISRLNSLRNNPYFEPLISDDVQRFDLLSEIQAAKLILIKAGIKEPLYGHIWLEQIDRIIDIRLAMPEERRMPTFIIIDEAQIFIGSTQNDHFADILDRAREAKIGMFVAVQHMGQIKSEHIRSSLYNSALKFVSRTNGDVHNLARAMGGDIEAKRFGSIPRYHFLFQSPDATEPELIRLPITTFPPWRWEDIYYFHKKLQSTRAPQPAPLTPPPEPEKGFEPESGTEGATTWG